MTEIDTNDASIAEPSPNGAETKRARRRVRRNRRIVAYGIIALLIVGFYYYQPQRIHFFPDQPPKPNPPVDPESAHLFGNGTKIALIQAHPDDSEFFLAPLLLRLAQSGAEIHQLVMTDGDKSFYFWTTEDANLRATREAEQREAASHYANEVQFLHKPDGRLEYQADASTDVKSFLDKVQPEYVLCFDPKYWPRVNHADHLASGRAAIEAAHQVPSVKWLLLFDTTAANFNPDVSQTVDQGVDMLAIHKSQFSGAKLAMLKNMRLESYYDAGRAKSGGYVVPLRAVKVSH